MFINSSYNTSNTNSNHFSCNSFNWDSTVYTQSGVYTNTYTNINGCDSIHTINLTITNSSNDTISINSNDTQSTKDTDLK